MLELHWLSRQLKGGDQSGFVVDSAASSTAAIDDRNHQCAVQQVGRLCRPAKVGLVAAAAVCMPSALQP
jgi:hypothetical protein